MQLLNKMMEQEQQQSTDELVVDLPHASRKDEVNVMDTFENFVLNVKVLDSEGAC